MNTINRATHREESGRVSINQGWTHSGVMNRLAAYEDTGLEPEEIEDALSRFSELLCYLTNNHMSKTNYTMGAMLSEIEDVRQEACERYCDLKQAEQEGRLVVLPCKVGDTVYIVDRGKILEEEVIGFSTFNTKSGDTVTAMTASYGYYVTKPNINDLGVLHSGNRLSFFFTRAEAEAALKGVSE